MDFNILVLILSFALVIEYADARKNPTTITPSIIPNGEEKEEITCGSFVQYFDHDEVVKFGFSAGRYMDDTQSYVGMGFDPRCEHSYNNPARLKATGPSQGAYMSCEHETHDTRIMRYLKSHPSLKWVKSNGSVLHKRNLVRIKSGVYDFWFGRKQLRDSNGNDYYVVSKVFDSGEMLYSIGGAHYRTFDIEVLSC